MSAEAAERAGVRALAEIGTHGNVTGPDNSLHSQPSNAIRQAPAKAGRTISDLDLIEINEAFAIVAIQSMRDLNVGHDKVNVNGGAIALGHPLGASGAPDRAAPVLRAWPTRRRARRCRNVPRRPGRSAAAPGLQVTRRGWHRQHTGTGSIWQRQSWYAHSTAAELQRARLKMTCAPFIDVEGSGRVHANARPGARQK